MLGLEELQDRGAGKLHFQVISQKIFTDKFINERINDCWPRHC